MGTMTAKQRDRLIDAAQNAFRYSVHGRGAFPFDMLRYDLAWPATQDDVVALTVETERGVRLRGLKEPTPERWATFGWRVEVDR